MPTDHPDGTFPVAFIMADIKMPVDIQAQYVTLAVDIKAQTLSQVNINIAAQTLGQLNVNIAASAITMNVAVTGTANISVTAQTVGVYLQPEWASKEGKEKGWLYSGSQKPPAGTVEGEYVVNAGKTLFITSIQASCHAYMAADGDKLHSFRAYVHDSADNFDLMFGGVGGGSVDLGKSLRVDGGGSVYATVTNTSNHDCNLSVSWQGYEI